MNHTCKFLVLTDSLPLFLFLSLFAYLSLFSLSLSLSFFSPSNERYIAKMKTKRLVDDLVTCLTASLATDEIITFLKPFKLYLVSPQHRVHWLLETRQKIVETETKSSDLGLNSVKYRQNQEQPCQRGNKNDGCLEEGEYRVLQASLSHARTKKATSGETKRRERVRERDREERGEEKRERRKSGTEAADLQSRVFVR